MTALAYQVLGLVENSQLKSRRPLPPGVYSHIQDLPGYQRPGVSDTVQGMFNFRPLQSILANLTWLKDEIPQDGNALVTYNFHHGPRKPSLPVCGLSRGCSSTDYPRCSESGSGF